ncbi:spore germination protein KB [Paenibacillus phyllosphaerae]|uniref:Spore germination protein KB n=1 Tax=Paenibacillus phyllosphaerae TaxID=274593 RepID=A0A7W5B313_9BACL|nr:endospore germination permease [Paenibacillus phyllosphaerae]MBB3112981.1 spore germination protein KB [Paenibacillus phyllosphaerae]
MLDNGKVSIQQIAILILLASIGDSILILPSAIAGVAGQDTWISCLVGIVLGLAVLAIMLLLARKFPRDSYIQIMNKLLGRWAGGALGAVLLCYTLIIMTTMVREVGDFMVSQMMTDTPLWSIHILLVLIMIFSVRGGIETIGRTSEIFLPIFVIFVAAFLLMTMPNMEPIKLQPIMGKGWFPVMQGSVFMTTMTFTELFAFLFLLPYVKRDKHMERDILLAAGLGGMAVSMVATACILVLGSYISAHHLYPAYALAKKISIGNFLERVEALLAVIWVISVFFKAVVFMYAFNTGVAHLLRLKDQRSLALPVGIILFSLADVIAPNISYYNDVLNKDVPFSDLTFGLVIPLGLLLVAYIRGRMADSSRQGS